VLGIESAADYLKAIDGRAQDLSSFEEGVPKMFTYVGHPCVDHIRVTRSGFTFMVQVFNNVCVSLPPAALDRDPTQAFREAWRGDEADGYFMLDADAVAILTYAVERETLEHLRSLPGVVDEMNFPARFSSGSWI
jgi:hypothetical protein